MAGSENITVLRILDGRLAAFTAGSDEQAKWLDDDDSLAQLREAVAQRRTNAVFAAPGEDVRLQELQISPEEKKHLDKSLPYMLEEQLAEDVDGLHFATAPLAPLSYSVALCSLDKMAQWQEQLAGLEGIGQWLPEPLLLPWQQGEWTLLLEGDRVLMRTGACEGLAAERELLPVMLASAEAGSGVPTALIVYGENQQDDIDLLPEHLQSAVQWRKGNFCTALLLSSLESGVPNLRQGEFSSRLPLRRWWQQWRMVAAVFAVAFLLQLLATGADYWQLKQENLALRTAVQSSYREAYPRGAVVDAEKQLRRQLDALRGSGQSSGFVSLLERVGSVISARPGTAIASINYSDKSGEMRMNILASDYEAVEQIRAGINKAGLEAVMENSSAQGDRVRARLRIGERS
ncbi:MAG: type II secretion system protein GspL [Halieaceae bacterium]